MKLLIQILLLFFIVPTCGQSDEHIFSSNCGSLGDLPCRLVVVPLGGVKLRQTPGFDGRVLATLAHGTVVEVLAVESLDRYDANGPNYVLLERMPVTPDSVRGVWARVRTQQKTGWVFASFLSDRLRRMTEPVYLLRAEERGCSEIAYASIDYRYYGLFANADSSVWELRSVRPVFYSNVLWNPDGFTGTGFRLAGEPAEPAFVVATKTPLTIGPLTKTYPAGQVIFKHNPGYERVENRVRVPGTPRTLIVEQVPGQALFVVALVDNVDGRKQVLTESFPAGVMLLRWVGDLDGDGQPDFILELRHRHGPIIQLFLTRGAGPGRMVVPTLPFWTGEDCC